MISMDSVLHCTEFENLQSILRTEGIKVQYCNELLLFKDLNVIDIAIPMVSFSDTPLELLGEKIESYGSCGIGLIKSWAVAKKLNPVLYVDTNSVISEILKHQNIRVQFDENNYDAIASDEHYHLIAYMKNYEAELIRDNKTYPNFRFYDEREWRYVASRELLLGHLNFYRGEYYRQHKNEIKTSPSTTLNFSSSDITHLIVSSDQESKQLKETLKFVYREKGPIELQRLYDLIIVREVIKR